MGKYIPEAKINFEWPTLAELKKMPANLRLEYLNDTFISAMLPDTQAIFKDRDFRQFKQMTIASKKKIK